MIDPKKYVIKLVQNTVGRYASTESSSLFNKLCSDLGINVVEDSLPNGIDGMLKGKTILINSNIQSEERKRFTRFHEMMHHLLNKDAYLLSELHEYTCNQENGYKKQLEILCNIGAAEFLMPRKEFTKLYQEKDFNVKLILDAADHFKASTIAATIQLAQIAPNKCIATVWEYGLVPKDTDLLHNSLFITENQSYNKPKWHVVYSASSLTADRWLTKYTTFPDDHLINQAFRQDRMIEGCGYIHFPSWKEDCYCEAFRHKDKVYALFHLTLPPSPDQMSLF